MSEMCRVVQSSRTVIANKLLAALNDEDKVAILATEIDLNILIEALKHWWITKGSDKAHTMAQDLARLKREAFD